MLQDLTTITFDMDRVLRILFHSWVLTPSTLRTYVLAVVVWSKTVSVKWPFIKMVKAMSTNTLVCKLPLISSIVLFNR